MMKILDISYSEEKVTRVFDALDCPDDWWWNSMANRIDGWEILPRASQENLVNVMQKLAMREAEKLILSRLLVEVFEAGDVMILETTSYVDEATLEIDRGSDGKAMVRRAT